MNIWLDDIRNPPDNFLWVQTPEDCIAWLLLNKGHVDILSLDHDLDLIDPNTLEERTGYDVLLFLERQPECCPREIRIHTANVSARRRMELALGSIERRRNA